MILVSAPSWGANASCVFSFATFSSADLNEELVVGTYRSLLEVHAGKLGMPELLALRDGEDPFLIRESPEHDLGVLRTHLRTYRDLLKVKGWDTPDVRSMLLNDVAASISAVEVARIRGERNDDYSVAVPKEAGDSSSFNFILPAPGKALVWRMAKSNAVSDYRPRLYWIDSRHQAHYQAEAEKLPLGRIGFTKILATTDGSALFLAAGDGRYHWVPWQEGAPDWSHAVSVEPKKPGWFARNILGKGGPRRPPEQTAVVGTTEPRLVGLVGDSSGPMSPNPIHKSLDVSWVLEPYYLEIFDPKTKTVKRQNLTFPTPREWATHLFSVPEASQVVLVSVRENEKGENPETVLRRYDLLPNGSLKEIGDPKAWPITEPISRDHLSWTQLTPGGRHLVVAGDRKVLSYGLENGRVVNLASGKHERFKLALSPDGNAVAVKFKRDDKPWLRVIDLDSGEATFETELPRVSNDIAYGPDSNTIYAQRGDTVFVINLAQRLRQ